MNRIREEICIWLAWKLPRRLVYWCAVRVFTYATVGKYGDTVVPSLNGIEALDRWD